MYRYMWFLFIVFKRFITEVEQRREWRERERVFATINSFFFMLSEKKPPARKEKKNSDPNVYDDKVLSLFCMCV